MYEGLASHCRQQYAGRFEIFLASAARTIPPWKRSPGCDGSFPSARSGYCVPQRLGTSGKVSTLVQMLGEAQYDYVLINDSDIRVSRNYLTRVMGRFGDGAGIEDPKVGMVTAFYLGRTAIEGAALTLWSRLEALGIATDFMAGVLAARRLEGGIRFGLGSTLAPLARGAGGGGGLEPLVDSLADDYEMGARIAQAGYKVELCSEVVETAVPAYDFPRDSASTRSAGRGPCATRGDGVIWGWGITYCIPWAVLNCVASGFALWSFTLLSLVVLARVAVALAVGVGVLGDAQVLRDIWLLPLRDCFGLGFRAWSYASDTIVWRGERFHLRNGRISRS